MISSGNVMSHRVFSLSSLFRFDSTGELKNSVIRLIWYVMKLLINIGIHFTIHVEIGYLRKQHNNNHIIKINLNLCVCDCDIVLGIWATNQRRANTNHKVSFVVFSFQNGLWHFFLFSVTLLPIMFSAALITNEQMFEWQ